MKKRIKWIVAAVVVIAAGVLSYGLVSAGVSTETYRVSKGEITRFCEETGQVKSADRHTVYAEGTGMVTEVFAEVGDTVKQGDLLLTLDKTDLELQLKNAEAAIAASKAQLESTELRNYADEIEQARASVNQAKINNDSAQRSFKNAEELFASQALSREEYDSAQDALKAAAEVLAAANLRLADIEKGAPEYVRNGYAAQLEQAEITRDMIANSISKLEVRAPAAGTVVEKLAEAGTPASPQMPVFVIEDTGKLEIEAGILSDDVNRVKPGNAVEISGKPLDDLILKGKVKKIAPSAKAEISPLGVSQNRVLVTIEANDDTSLLKPGFSVDVKIITASANAALRVPDTAVFDYKGKSGVFVVEKGKARLRTVVKGIENDDFIEIREGLKEGELVIAKPDNGIREGSGIKAK
ncbi:MAG TPA: efflux RND transporter periplasmic adaptor subunit [Clostridia bacterium]|nr:efflux RND transporter periplasmic adaptor subunit [Clostridia bacterium]